MLHLEVEGLIELVALGLPLLALLTIMALASRQIRRRRDRAGSIEQTGRYGVPIEERAEAREAAASAQGPAEVPPPPAPAPPPSASDISRQIKEAEAQGSERGLAGLYLSLAHDHVANNRQAEAREDLLKCIRLAARLGEKDVHARARLELGDLSREQGDLTTACEHWQMARQLFFELKSAAPLAQAETRMRQNRCPTDWVLNDF